MTTDPRGDPEHRHTSDAPEGYDYWTGDHPDHPFSDWRQEVMNSSTRLGYWEWVKYRMDER